ncbi:hypothetical protein [Rubrobacter indicoceani]|uniref:hypothetical protein n=1 Tax=Rubrobacter indicoceani TaxID=2051957 RepID=UPI0013C47F9D|nr:hypothetical protein [Rubrobacter indicoceani]
MKRSADFDPVRHGFAFRNPLGAKPGGESVVGRLAAPFIGRGLCFGMVVAALSGSVGDASRLEPTPSLIDHLSRLHLKQFRPPALVAVARYWLRSRGGGPEFAVRRLRVAGSTDPHIVCFGPDMSLNFLKCAGKSHAVAPYRVERSAGEVRVFVYDPNRPQSRDRCIVFDTGRGTFSYEGFTSERGFGLVLLPLSALGVVSRFPGG